MILPRLVVVTLATGVVSLTTVGLVTTGLVGCLLGIIFNGVFVLLIVQLIYLGGSEQQGTLVSY